MVCAGHGYVCNLTLHCANTITAIGCPCLKKKKHGVQKRQLKKTNKSCVQPQVVCNA